jgi:hypothetical protein
VAGKEYRRGKAKLFLREEKPACRQAGICFASSALCPAARAYSREAEQKNFLLLLEKIEGAQNQKL